MGGIMMLDYYDDIKLLPFDFILVGLGDGPKFNFFYELYRYEKYGCDHWNGHPYRSYIINFFKECEGDLKEESANRYRDYLDGLFKDE